MRTRKSIQLLAVLAAYCTLVLASGCEEQDPAAADPANQSTSCRTGEAEIMVSEGFVENLCGCAEGSGLQQTQGQPLHCTVPVGTQVFFTYLGVVSVHQIISTGTPSFASSPPYDPTDSSESQVAWPFQPTVAGSYAYEDLYFPTVTGVVIAQ